MTIHISLRLAWHTGGWDGHVCRDPAANTWCVGPNSYPGEWVAEHRNLEWEKAHCGESCAAWRADDPATIPACIYSINAFGKDRIRAYADTPEFFTERSLHFWDLPPATACVWPYETMYGDDVKLPGSRPYDYDKRRENARRYFAPLEKDRTLVFYYANYSNPFSEEDERRYVLVGISRLKEIGEELFYSKLSPELRKRYGGGFIWQRAVTSHYPDQGFRVPYHRYVDKPEVLDRILVVPENPRNFKYATRQIADDDALSLVERLLEVVADLREIDGDHEDWGARMAWLESLVAELWGSRGLFPGMPRVLDLLGFGDAVLWFRTEVERGEEKAAHDRVIAFIRGDADELPGLVDVQASKRVRRQWMLRTDGERRLLADILPRFDLLKEQMECVLSKQRESHGIHSGLDDLAANPYLLCEQYVGDGPDDFISFHKIDHGILPSPDLGGTPLSERDSPERLRALMVERLRRENRHTFLPVDQVLADINHRLSFLPEWKRHVFSGRYIDVDREVLEKALVLRRSDDARTWAYLQEVHDDERAVERICRDLAGAPAVPPKRPLPLERWRTYLRVEESLLAKNHPVAYGNVLDGQARVCAQVYPQRLAVICGEAGTGKTTLLKALIQAIRYVDGEGHAIQLLAPTGKAADRMRERTGVESACTVHSFLARHGWLNDNLSFRRSGGKKEEAVGTYIVDEASMLDLGLAAALFRSIDWRTVKRLVLVGDPNQLPPIGRGRVFADVVDWLERENPDGVGRLDQNVRQLENKLEGRGTAILELAGLYTRMRQAEAKDMGAKQAAEAILQRVAEGGDVDRDLRVRYWHDAKELGQLLVDTIVGDMQADTGETLDPEARWKLWSAAAQAKAHYHQVITPYRGELFGTEHLNGVVQREANGARVERTGCLDGITIFDKVIQVRNRPVSDPLYAWNTETRSVERVEIFNGELGFVKPHGLDRSWKWHGFRLGRFQVTFARKEHLWVNYGHDLGKRPDGRWIPKEPPEENLELAYAISVHKCQGSEFERVYFVVPKSKKTLLSPELFYTGLTRASRHCTLLIEEDEAPLHSMRRPESSHLARTNASLFGFNPIADELLQLPSWYEEGKYHRSFSDVLVRSKSEVIIANMLAEREIPFRYEVPLRAPDGTFYLPDFTITWRGETYYWEHLGRLDLPKYRERWETKRAWYEKHFPGHLLTTEESPELSRSASDLIVQQFR